MDAGSTGAPSQSGPAAGPSSDSQARHRVEGWTIPTGTGALHRDPGSRRRLRTIPACARGMLLRARSARTRGPSLRVRGARVEHHARLITVRTIPWVQGGAQLYDGRHQRITGASPQAREAHSSQAHPVGRPGTIPAGAGSTSACSITCSALVGPVPRDGSTVRSTSARPEGGKAILTGTGSIVRLPGGPSVSRVHPRAGGALPGGISVTAPLRAIPADAGSTLTELRVSHLLEQIPLRPQANPASPSRAQPRPY